MEKIEKKTLLYSVQNHIANFISEEHQIKDVWIQTYEFNGVFFNVYAYGYERWLEENPELIEIIVE